MRSLISILLPVGLMGLLLIPLDTLLQAWLPAWWVIIGALACASTAFGIWFESERRTRGHVSLLRYALGIVLILSLSWGFLWSLGEEGLIRWSEATRPPNDHTLHRYFYPGNSGMGDADGLSKPFKVLWRFGLLGTAIYAICVIPHALLNASNHRPSSQQLGAPNATTHVR